MNFKKKLSGMSALALAALFLGACASEGPIQGGSKVLRVLNWEDYIYLNDPENGYDAKSMINQFEDFILEEEGIKVEVVYDTFDTNETMFSSLQTGKSVYDLVCPSDYMIQKMIAADMLEPLGEVATKVPNYDQYASPYLKDVFASIEATNLTTNETHTIDEYAVGYMWGTFGILYNPTYAKYEEKGLSKEDVIADMADWNSLWDPNYQNSIFIKDSMRDTYSIGIMRVFDDEIRALQATYLDEESLEYDPVRYNNELTEIFNRSDISTVNEVKAELLSLKENFYGFEGDNGKQDIAREYVGIDTAWSGDAVYAMNMAEEETPEGETPVELYYSIPETGGNVWFDGWVMPKSDSLNKDLALKFMDFMSDPVNAAQNMDYIGYSSFIGGEDINALVHEWYDVRGEEWETPLADPENYVAYDLTYFFGDTVDSETIIYLDEESVGRQLNAQYPDGDMIPRLAIMRDFGVNNRLILEMWEEVQASNLPGWAIALIVVGVLAVAGFGGFFLYKKNLVKKNRSNRRHQAPSNSK